MKICFIYLQKINFYISALVIQSCSILCNPMDCSPPGSSVHEILQYWSGLPFPSPGHLPNPGIEPGSPALQAVALPSELLGKSKVIQLCPTLCVPMEYTVHGILQARILEWVAVPFSRGSSQPRNRTQVFALQVDSLPAEPPGEAQEYQGE